MKSKLKKTVITVRQIAEHANVSLGTVSNVLNGATSVREDLRKRVMSASKRLGYEPSALAKGMRGSSINLLGMIIPDILNPFFPGVVRGVEDVAYESGHRLVLCNTDNDPRKEISYLSDLRSFRPAGLLVIPAIYSTIMQSFRPTDPPVVFAARPPDRWKGDSVIADNFHGGHLAAQHLLELGHTSLATIAGPLHLHTSVARLDGFKHGLAEAGLVLRKKYIQESLFDSASGYVAATRLLKLKPRPTAIFAANDLLAMGALAAIRQSGLHCPEDVSVVGFDNLDVAEHTFPALTTVHESGYQMGATACRILLERIRNNHLAPSKIVLPTELRVRNSTRAIHPKMPPAG
jgi:DNA-binding LacI/PurR family transcriptional regulator